MNDRVSKKSVIYNVYPTSFFDSNGDGIGDLNGITQKLDYIAQFADYVWINPIFVSPFKDGGYDVVDYYDIDKKFGTIDDLKTLLRRANELGLKVLLDLVVGHTSDQHPWFQASQKSEKNPFTDRYVWTNGVFDECPYFAISGNSERNGNYFINFFHHQPSLNYGFAKVSLPWQMHYQDARLQPLKDEVVNIINYYMELGVTGFRVDMAGSIVKDDPDGKCSAEVWKEIFGKVREKYPHATFVSEWGVPAYAVCGDCYDIDFLTHCHSDGYNRLFRKELGTNVFVDDGDSFFRPEGKGEADTFFDYFLSNLEKVGDKGWICVPSGNHDLPRLAQRRTDDGMKTAYAFLLALPSVPLIYYGDEIGMKFNPSVSKDGGYNRTGARTPMQWSAEKNAGFSTAKTEDLYLPVNDDYAVCNVKTQSKDENSLMNTLKRMLAIRKAYPQLGSEAKLEVICKTYPIVLKLNGETEDFYALINPSARAYTLSIANAKTLEMNNTQQNGDSFTLGGESFVWLTAPKDTKVVL